MKKRQRAALVIILMFLMVFLASCVGGHPEYNFEGKIGDEQIRFVNGGVLNNNIALIVKKANGTIIEYIDRGRDLKIDRIKISNGGQVATYRIDSDNPVVQALMVEGQKQFDEYLKKIHEINSAPLYNK